MSDAPAPEAAAADAAETSEPPIELPGIPDPESPVVAESKGFNVHLVNFEGPFDLLLQLISKHKLDITEIALSVITDEFIAYIKALGSEWDLDQTSEFLLIAATLLDLKAARLLPSGDVEDAEDLALLEARDLLFARLLQYRAFKQIAGLMQQRMAEEAKRFPRAVGMEPRFADLLPEVLLGVDPEGLAKLAARALAPKREVVPEGVSLAHLHAPAVTVREQAAVIIERLRRQRSTTFRLLVADSPDTVTTVCRFLALLELFREAAVSFEQETPLGELTVRWTGTDDGEIAVGDEFDEVAAPADGEGEAPVVSDETDFLEPGELLTEPDPEPESEVAPESATEPDTEPGTGPEEHETVEQ
ncbi:segregation and condensation protein A [Kribbella sp. CA-293567]|uniref:segregation and condensation protein A n=1 Tax=Kribbella sp. CA-293567 TaxID=3002436 RepID=UPI0022DD7B40|nr:segregation/condensation protein A [Kribbella sp. CA-293567]WBQ07356.1 segregation/condensation protein A [Kribbella sp. CA-293567]